MIARTTASRRFSTLLSALSLLLVWTAPLHAKERYLQKFYDEIVVTPDGKVDVTENITFRFVGGPWHGIERFIPVEYVGPSGLNYTLFLDVRLVTDEAGRALRFESSRERQYRKLRIYIPNADNSTRTVSVEYVVSDALKFFDDHD